MQFVRNIVLDILADIVSSSCNDANDEIEYVASFASRSWTIEAIAFSIGHHSGGHLNCAVTFSQLGPLWLSDALGRFARFGHESCPTHMIGLPTLCHFLCFDCCWCFACAAVRTLPRLVLGGEV